MTKESTVLTKKAAAQLVIVFMAIFPLMVLSIVLDYTLVKSRLVADVSYRTGETQAIQSVINKHPGPRIAAYLSQDLRHAEALKEAESEQLANHSNPIFLYSLIALQGLLALIGGWWLVGVVNQRQDVKDMDMQTGE